jgi:hypothetical protein
LTYKINVLYEEFEAWKEGYNIAKELGLYIDKRKYELLKTKCLVTYLSWALPASYSEKKAK